MLNDYNHEVSKSSNPLMNFHLTVMCNSSSETHTANWTQEAACIIHCPVGASNHFLHDFEYEVASLTIASTITDWSERVVVTVCVTAWSVDYPTLALYVLQDTFAKITQPMR